MIIYRYELENYKGSSLQEYRLNKSRRAFERVYGRLKRYVALWSPLLSIGIMGLGTQMYV